MTKLVEEFKVIVTDHLGADQNLLTMTIDTDVHPMLDHIYAPDGLAALQSYAFPELKEFLVLTQEYCTDNKKELMRFAPRAYSHWNPADYWHTICEQILTYLSGYKWARIELVKPNDETDGD